MMNETATARMAGLDQLLRIEEPKGGHALELEVSPRKAPKRACTDASVHRATEGSVVELSQL